MFHMQNKGCGKAAKVVNFVAKWLNLCLSTVFSEVFSDINFCFYCNIASAPLKIVDFLRSSLSKAGSFRGQFAVNEFTLL